MAKHGKAGQQPVLNANAVSNMNMVAVKRIDNEIEEILATAQHVCLYRMSVDDQQWQRKNVEGSLFLIKRRTQPRFQMLVLNKLQTDNYFEPIHGGLELETNPPYLMYTHGNDEIHGIWFFDEADLHRVSGLMSKILAQLPKPDGSAAAAAAAAPPPVVQHQHQPAPLLAAEQHQHSGGGSLGGEAPAAAAGASSSRGGDAFWDRSVHVTEETVQHSQQLVPNSNLLADNPAAGGGGGGGGLQGLLKAAQQKHSSAQRAPLSPVPVPNSTSMPPGEPMAAGGGGAGALLTPAFFEAQHKQPAAAGAAPPEAQAPVPPPASAVGAAVNGSSNPLQQLLSRAAKSTPSSSGSGAAAPGGVRGAPQPPLGVLPPQLVRDKLKAALIRLANNDAFVDALAGELKTVGLIQ